MPHLDRFFAGMFVKNISSQMLRKFVAALHAGEVQDKVERKEHGKSGVVKDTLANGSINRIPALLRRMMNLARKDGLIQAVPHFPMLKETNVRSGFVEDEQFNEILKHLPEHLHSLIVFLYRTGCRLGAALQITWDMVSPDCKLMILPGQINKNKEAITLPVPTPVQLVLKKQFRRAGQPVFEGTKLRTGRRQP